LTLTLLGKILFHEKIKSSFLFYPEILAKLFKGWVHWFSMQVLMNKQFLLNPKQKLAQIRLNVKSIFNSKKW